MAINPTNRNNALGSTAIRAFGSRKQNLIMDNIISQLNEILDGVYTMTDLTLTGDLIVGDDADVVGDLTAGTIASDANVTATTTLSYGTLLTEGLTAGATAFATGGQASATAITTSVVNFTTVATAGDSGKLPTAAPGLTVTVKNSGAAALDIFPATSDSIDALAVNLAVRIQPGSVATFRAISATVWESSIDETITIVAPTTNTGALVFKAVASAGNFTTTVQNASQAAARVYTIPDAGGNASFVQTEGAQTINGAKTFGSGIALPDGTVGDLSVKIGADSNNGLYGVSDTQLGIAVEGALVATADTLGLTADSVRNRVALGSTPGGIGTISAVEYGDGRDITTVITLTNTVLGAPTAGAASAVGALIYTFPAGAHLHEVTYMSVGLTIGTVTTDTPDVGVGSVIASGASALLSTVGATSEDYITGQTAADAAGTATVKTTVATAGALTGISINEAASVKAVHINAADTWDAAITGNLTATGTVTLKWTKLSA